MLIKLCTWTAKSAPFRTENKFQYKTEFRIGAETQPPHIAGLLAAIIKK
jgi:hypothetical protein